VVRSEGVGGREPVKVKGGKPSLFAFGKKDPGGGGRKRRTGDPPDYTPSFATQAACADLARCETLADFERLLDSWRGSGSSMKPSRY
jgi:hypothetical protein